MISVDMLRIHVAINAGTRVASFRFGGVLTDRGFVGSRGGLMQAIDGAADGFVSRLERVVMAPRQPDWGASGLNVSSIKSPGAIVVRPAELASAEVYAGMMRERGFERRCFIDAADAESWVAEQVALHLAQARWWRARSVP
jgi:hypothetical protein